MKKLLALLAGLALIAVAQPVGADHAVIAVNVNGGLALELDNECDLDGDGIDDPGTHTASFTGVTMTGSFGAHSSDAVYTGQVETPGIEACIFPELEDPFGEGVPIISSGVINGGPFGTDTNAVGIASDGGPACLSGEITSGTFATSGVVARADFELNWELWRPDGNTCGDTNVATLGTTTAQMATATVVAVPLGNIVTGAPSTVTGLVTDQVPGA